MFSLVFVCLFVRSSVYVSIVLCKTSQMIFTKFGGNVARGHRRNEYISLVIRMRIRIQEFLTEFVYEFNLHAGLPGIRPTTSR